MYANKIAKEVESLQLANFSFPDNACPFWDLREISAASSGEDTSTPFPRSVNISCSSVFQIQKKTLLGLFPHL